MDNLGNLRPADLVPARLVQVKSPTGCSWFFSDGEVLAAAQPLSFLVGWQDARVRAYIAANGWQARVVPPRVSANAQTR